ncbi:MAG: acetylxylan esterase [Verrucomicrobiae bacterium]|nr:acetylxylan esterase [Verrucomicrobiae bacterium]
MTILSRRLSFSALPTLVLLASLAVAAEPSLQVSLDRPAAIYSTGETATFTIGGSLPTGTEITWTTSLDGYRNLETGKATAGATVSASLEGPGFVLLSATAKGPDGKALKAEAGAAFSPEAISPSLPVPEDFDGFWAEQKKRLAAIPLEPVLTAVPLTAKSDANLEAYDVSVPAEETGPPVSGYFALPKKAAAKSLPAVLWVHGAGVRSSSLPTAVSGARDGFLSMDINAHGLPNGKPEDYYKGVAAGDLKSYRTDGNTSRETVYFRGMFVRLQRALDFLTSRPEWNGKVLAVVGHSQGGYQALVAGGLDPRVTFIGAGVPAGCDHTGMKAGRISGWPKLVAMTASGSPNAASLEASRYVDAVNFASRCGAEAVVSVGFIDRTCPPTSVYAAYNVLKGPKRILTRPAMGHAAPEDIKTEFRQALLKHAGIAMPEPAAK